ncbi:hypothetical protein Droror1_Dr00007776 [Drosera rotundifolia]
MKSMQIQTKRMVVIKLSFKSCTNLITQPKPNFINIFYPDSLSVLHPSPPLRSSLSSPCSNSRAPSVPDPVILCLKPISDIQFPPSPSQNPSPSSSISFLKPLILLTHLKISTNSSHFRLFFSILVLHLSCPSAQFHLGSTSSAHRPNPNFSYPSQIGHDFTIFEALFTFW